MDGEQTNEFQPNTIVQQFQNGQEYGQEDLRGVQNGQPLQGGDVQVRPPYKPVGLYSFQIENDLKYFSLFLGCFPSDRLPPFPTEFPKHMIINTQGSSLPGQHWNVLLLEKVGQAILPT
jgi:hypothetical protein